MVRRDGGAGTGFQCCVCGRTTNHRSVLRKLHKCIDCGFVTYPAPQTIDFDKLYDDGYFSGQGDYPDYLGQQDALRRSMRQHLAQMRRFKPLGGSLLEVGCAYGLFLDEARVHFNSVTGIDVCGGPVAHARDILRLDARVGDFAAFDFDHRQFDAICFWDTIEHLPHPEIYLAQAARVLAQDGVLYLTTADVGSLNARFRGAAWRQIHPPSHLHYFSRGTIGRLCERIGLEVIGIETAAYYHTVYNVLASLGIANRPVAHVARMILSALGETRARQWGLWINLGDIMFVAARPRTSR